MLAALLLIACQDPTEVVVFIDSDPELRAAQNELRVEVLPLLVDEVRDPVEMEAGAASMPTSITLVPRTVDETRFRLTAEVRDAAGTPLARARILTRFVSGESRALYVRLIAGGLECGERETWNGTECVPACVDEPELPRAPDPPTPTGRCDATCAAAEDGEPCVVDGTPGRCWTQACCLGCWNGEACLAGDSVEACGSRGAECEACVTDPPCSDRCEQQCVPAERVGAVAAGHAHTCASGEGVYCWGGNSRGQLGTGTTAERQEMTRVLASGAFDLAAGEHHTCAINWSRKVSCWGGNHVGQVGDGTGTDRLTPQTGPDLETQPSGWLDVSSSQSTTCAIHEDGSGRTLYCWGQNAAHQAGQPGPVDSSVITMRLPLGAPDGWIDVSSGYKHGAAIDGAGRLWTWGGVTTGDPIADYATIVRPPDDESLGYELRDASGGRTWRAVAAARFGTCAIDSASELSCSGQLKQALFPGRVLADLWPLEHVDPGPVVHVSQGFNHVCFISEDESLHCVGSNLRGELGVVDTMASRSRIGPVGAVWERVAVGYAHTCAVRTSGALYCWGNNPLGQVGGTEPEVRTPLRVCLPP